MRKSVPGVGDGELRTEFFRQAIGELRHRLCTQLFERQNDNERTYIHPLKKSCSKVASTIRVFSGLFMCKVMK